MMSTDQLSLVALACLALVRAQAKARHAQRVQKMRHAYTDSPYKKIPSHLLAAFTQGNKIPVLDWFLDNSRPKGVKWTNKSISGFIKRFTPEKVRLKKEGRSSYGHRAVSHLLQSFEKYNVTNQHVAVVGSESPWIEALLINLENSVTTIEYNVPRANFQNLKCKDYFRFFENNENAFDCVVTFSSIEHSGLGRYGDPLEPDGDIKTMQTIHKNLKQGGLLIWGAPVGHDALVWNAHRIYGRLRLPLMFAGFEELEWFTIEGASKETLLNSPLARRGFQPVVVLRKTSPA